MTVETEKTQPTPEPLEGRAAEWAEKSVHQITLVSGMTVGVRLPDLAVLIEGDVLPERLREVAAQMWQDGVPDLMTVGAPDDVTVKPALDMDKVKGLAQLRRHLASLCVVEPAMTPDQFLSGGIPAEDVDLLASIAMRERDTDALGVKLGVTPLSHFETFRQEHGCAEDCPGCEATSGRFSTRRVVSV